MPSGRTKPKPSDSRRATTSPWCRLPPNGSYASRPRAPPPPPPLRPPLLCPGPAAPSHGAPSAAVSVGRRTEQLRSSSSHAVSSNKLLLPPLGRRLIAPQSVCSTLGASVTYQLLATTPFPVVPRKHTTGLSLDSSGSKSATRTTRDQTAQWQPIKIHHRRVEGVDERTPWCSVDTVPVQYRYWCVYVAVGVGI